jgi:hypothetical protein
LCISWLNYKPVNHVSKIWPGNNFQPLYILIFGVNISSIMTISQFGMYIQQVHTTDIFEIIILGSLGHKLSVPIAISYPVFSIRHYIHSQDAIFCCCLVFLNVCV